SYRAGLPELVATVDNATDQVHRFTTHASHLQRQHTHPGTDHHRLRLWCLAGHKLELVIRGGSQRGALTADNSVQYGRQTTLTPQRIGRSGPKPPAPSAEVRARAK